MVCYVYFASFISNRSKQRIKEEIDYVWWKNHRTLKNDRYRCVRRGIGIDTMRGVSRELRSWNSSATLLAHPSTPSTPLSPFYRRRPSPGIYLFPRGSYAARCLVSRLSGTSEQRDETGGKGRSRGSKERRGICEGARVREGWDSASGYTLGS